MIKSTSQLPAVQKHVARLMFESAKSESGLEIFIRTIGRNFDKFPLFEGAFSRDRIQSGPLCKEVVNLNRKKSKISERTGRPYVSISI